MPAGLEEVIEAYCLTEPLDADCFGDQYGVGWEIVEPKR